MPTGVYKRTEKMIENMRKAKIGSKLSPETRNKISKSRIGIKFSESHRLKLSLAKKGKKRPKANKCPAWKGGKIKQNKGYLFVYAPDHPFKNCRGYVLNHRLVMEKKIGRFLKKGEIVHHINGIKSDDRPSNLICFKTSGEHSRHHRLLESSK